MDVTKVRLAVWVTVCAVVSLQPVPVLSSVNGGKDCAGEFILSLACFHLVFFFFVEDIEYMVFTIGLHGQL